MRAQLAALVRVQTPLEQRAEDRRLDGRPVQLRRPPRQFQVLRLQRQAVGIVEQPAVEPGNLDQAKPAAALHRREQFAGAVHECGGPGLDRRQQLAEQPARQQADVLREQAEQQPGHEMRHPWRFMAPLA